MLDPARSLHCVVAALNDCQARYAVVGGLAVSVQAEPRFTRDADLAVATSGDAEAEVLVFQLRAHGYQAFAALEHDQTDRLATIRLHDPHGSVVDLLFASSGIEPEIVEQAQARFVVPGLSLPVARVGHLMLMKALARDDRRRPADADDLLALAAVADESEWECAIAGARLVVQRGYDRGRDLVGAIENLRANPTQY